MQTIVQQCSEKAKERSVKELYESHLEIIRLFVLGYTKTEIAGITGYTIAHIDRIYDNPLVRERIATLQMARDAETVDIARDIQEYAPRSLRLLQKIVDGDEAVNDIRLRAKVAKDLLEMAGHGAVQKSAATVVHEGEVTLKGETCKEIVQEARAYRERIQRVLAEPIEEAEIIETSSQQRSCASETPSCEAPSVETYSAQASLSTTEKEKKNV